MNYITKLMVLSFKLFRHSLSLGKTRGKHIFYRGAVYGGDGVHLESSELSLCGPQHRDLGLVLYGSNVIAGTGDLDSSS